jgi:hypothetical protein
MIINKEKQRRNTMENNEDLMTNIGKIESGSCNTNIYKSAVITVDLAKYQNIKLYGSYSIAAEGLTKEEEIKLNKKIWVDRGDDLKYGLKCCLRKIAKMEKPQLKINDEEPKDKSLSAIIRKSCEISVEILNAKGQYQSSKFSSGKEWSIEYSSEGERKKIESEKWDEIAEDIEGCMVLFFDSLGKKTDAVEKFSELCKQKLTVKKVENVSENNQNNV